MIVVATDYDLVTSSLAIVAAQFVTSAAVANPAWPTGSLVPRKLLLLPDQAEVDGALKAHPLAAVVFFGHGYDAHDPQPGFHGQDQTPALDPAGAAILANRVVVAVCCHSLNAMATAAVAHGATVLGYDGSLNVSFPTLTGVDAAIRSCIAAGLRELINGNTVTDARDATRRAFSLLETSLRAHSHMAYQVASVFVKQNSQRHDVRGKSTATL